MSISFKAIISSIRAMRFLIALSAALTIASGAQAADIPGAKDPSFLKRYQGSEIVSYQTVSYDSYQIAAPDPKNPAAAWGFAPVEGQITRIIYRVPTGHTVLELLRNYEQGIRDAGLMQIGELPPFNDGNFGSRIYNQMWQKATDANYPLWGYPGNGGWQQMSYVTAKGAAGGQNVTIVVFVSSRSNPIDVKFGVPVHITPDSPIVMVDVVTQKGVIINMVTVKAADMADALATKGVVDLYGVYFDTDKMEVKPESGATLDEIASLLKIDRSLRLEISGHTDNTGNKDHNMQLSQGRANAVMAVLVSKYGIDAKRLTAKGYGDTKPVVPNDSDANKGKNRRVELRKL